MRDFWRDGLDWVGRGSDKDEWTKNLSGTFADEFKILAGGAGSIPLVTSFLAMS